MGYQKLFLTSSAGLRIKFSQLHIFLRINTRSFDVLNIIYSCSLRLLSRPIYIHIYVKFQLDKFRLKDVCIAGVYFPKYVRDICLQLGICGWVKNSKTGTILGKMQGPRAFVDQM